MSSSSTTTKEDAIRLLKDSSYLYDCPDALLEALAEVMEPVEVEDGHIFFEEGGDIHSIMILERGEIRRYKLSVEEGDFEEIQRQSIGGPQMSRTSSMEMHGVIVDLLRGRGRTTGLLHNFTGTTKAYATVSAHGSNVKVWFIKGEDFRSIVGSTPQFALHMMEVLATELRLGSKSLRAIVKTVKDGRSSSRRAAAAGPMTAAGEADNKVCKVLCYDTTSWVKEGFEPQIEAFNALQSSKNDNDDDAEGGGYYRIEMDFTTERLSEQSASYAAGYDAVCLFVNDAANQNILQTLSLLGVKMIALRCAGYDRVDMKAARAFGFTVARVPAYSPYAVAEMAISLLMTLNRNIHKASNRVKMSNFTLDAGLMGMDIHGKTVGVMGTGKIGQILCNIVLGLGAQLLCYDVYENDDVKQKGGVYVTQDEIYTQSDILFLMMPLLPTTKHTINHSVVSKFKKGVLLINTSRGGLIDTKALLTGLRNGQIGGVGMDVYENEQEYFFQDWSGRQVQDEDLVALLGQNNVILTAHQAFFTKEAVDKIITTTLDNFLQFQQGLTGQLHPNNCIPAFKE